MTSMADSVSTVDQVRDGESDWIDSIDHPSGFLALSPQNQHFSVPGIRGFIAYRDCGRHRISLAGVHALESVREQLLQEYLNATEEVGLSPLFVQLPKSQVELCKKFNMTVNQLGATYCMPLLNYTFAGTRKMKLRNKIKRASSSGLRIVELGKDRSLSKTDLDQLDAITNLWLANKKKKELEFMIGELGEDDRRRVFVVEDQSGRLVGFITYVPVWGRYPGYLHDLSRKLPDSPVGAMELCNSFAIERMKEEQIPYLHFGFTPFIVDDIEPPGANRIMAYLVKLLRLHGQMIYPADSQAQYKRKWGADILEYEYIAAKSLSLRAVFDLLLLTKSL